MVKIPRRGSPGWALLLGSLLVAFLGFVGAFVGIASLLQPSSDRISDVLYLAVGIILFTIAVFMFTSGLKYEDSPESLFAIDIDPRKQISSEESASKLTPGDRERLDRVKTDISNAPSPAKAFEILNTKSNRDLVLANPALQPIAFAVRPATSARYVKGVVLEVLTWAGVIISIPFIFVIDLWQGGQTVMYTAFRLSRRARQYRARPDKVFQTDARPPVLYLQSFLDAYGTRLESYLPTTSEEKLAKHYQRYGPVIAIGKPEEDLPLLGAARLYFDDDTWHAGVLYLMSISQLIIIQAGIAPGLLWELGSARKQLDPKKLIISFTSWEELEESTRDLRYLGFKKYAEELLGCELPPDIKTTSHISFGPGWLPRAQSEFRYSIPSLRRSRSRIKRVGAVAAIVISGIVTLTLGRSFLDWTIERLNTYTEDPAKWRHHSLAGLSVYTPAKPQNIKVYFGYISAEEQIVYGCETGDLSARMGYLRFPEGEAVDGEDILKFWTALFKTDDVTNLSCTPRQSKKDKFACDGQFMKAGTDYKLRGSLFVKGQQVWFILVSHHSNNVAASAATEKIINSLQPGS